MLSAVHCTVTTLWSFYVRVSVHAVAPLTETKSASDNL